MPRAGHPASDAFATSVVPVEAAVETPAFVIDERRIAGAMRIVDEVQARTGCRFLYALKPLANAEVLRMVQGHVSGFAASSLFGAEMARSVLAGTGSVHVTTPGFRPDEMDPKLLAGVEGLHFHSTCDSTSFRPLLRTVRHLMRPVPGPLQGLSWVNLAGGYLFTRGSRRRAHDRHGRWSGLGPPAGSTAGASWGVRMLVGAAGVADGDQRGGSKGGSARCFALPSVLVPVCSWSVLFSPSSR